MIKSLIYFIAGFLLMSANWYQPQGPNDPIEELNELHQRIDEHQVRIQSELSKKDSVLYKKIDYLQEKLPEYKLPEGHLAQYLKSIDEFLSLTNPTNDNWLENEEFLYFLPGLVDYDSKNKTNEYYNSQITRSLSYKPFLKDHITFQNFLNQISKQNPDSTIALFKAWNGDDNANEMMEHMAYHAPFEFKKFLHYRNSIRALVDLSSDLVVRKTWDIFDQYRFSAKSFYYLDDILNSGSSVDELELLLKDDIELENSIWSLNTRDDILGYHSIQTKMKEYSVKRAKNWNRSFSVGDIRSQSWDEIIPVLVYGHHKFFDANFTTWISDIPNKGQLPSAPLKRVLKADLHVFLQKLIDLELIETFESNLDPNAKAYISENMPGLINEYASRYKSYYYSILQPKVAPLKKVVSTKKYKAPEPIPLIEVYLDDYRKEEIKFRNNIGTSLANMEELVNDPFSYEKLMYAATEDPARVLDNYRYYINEYYALDVLEVCAKAAPMSAKKFLAKESHLVYEFLESSSDPVIQMLFEIKDQLGPYTRAYFLLDNIYNGTLTIKQADEIAKDEVKLRKYIAEIAIKSQAFGQTSAKQELLAMAINTVNKLNQKEGLGINTQLDYLSPLTDKQLFQILILGEGEFYSSTFQALFSTFVSRMSPSNGYEFFAQNDFKDIHPFIKMCSEYGTLDRFLNTSKKKEQNLLLKQFINDLEDNGDELEKVVYVVDAIVHMRNAKTLRTVFKEIQNGFERNALSNNQEGIAIYGLLAGIHYNKAQKDKEWFRYKSHQFIIPNVNMVANWNLFNYNDENIQQHFFYNDSDGHASYNNFIRHYKQNTEDWAVADQGSYVVIQSNSGKKVRIFANKPAQEITGQKAIVSYFESNDLEPKVVVHRGLSSHQHKTMERLPSSAVIINDGSCGGYQNMQVALDVCPNAQVISTRKIGTMHVNDPMFKMLNDDIRLGKDIYWDEFWQRARSRLGNNPHFADYVPPSQNVGAKFIQAYNLVMGL